MENYKKYLNFTLPVLLLAMGLIFYMASKKTRAEKDFLQAKLAYSKGDDLSYYLKRYPELVGKYGAEIKQKKIAGGKSILSSLQDGSVFAGYAKTTELVSAKKYKQALEESLLLKDKVEPYQTLTAFNLFRIASLYRELGEIEKEKEILRELKDTGKVSLLPHVKDQEVSLIDYINERLAI
ncbi:MAG: hypothetical protein KBC64_03195 [Simkaniaceae bacterium]|nr:hypothetical protein [Simkaniaceae bacterium]